MSARTDGGARAGRGGGSGCASRVLPPPLTLPSSLFSGQHIQRLSVSSILMSKAISNCLVLVDIHMRGQPHASETKTLRQRVALGTRSYEAIEDDDGTRSDKLIICSTIVVLHKGEVTGV